MSDIKQTLKDLARMIAVKGGRLYLVGGATRDELLGRENKDLDTECFGLEESSLYHLLQAFASNHELKFSEVGKSFKVLKLRSNSGEEVDVSLPRRDIKVGMGHKGFEVSSDPYMSLREAARRRDFTINAIYRDILTGIIHDPFRGMEDLEDRIIRMVDAKAFAEDPLRVLRALQFAARFDFLIEYNTLKEMERADLTELPSERVWTELEKGLLSKNASFMFTFPFINKQVFPEVYAIQDTPQDPQFHPEGTVSVHTRLVLDESAKLLSETTLSKPERLTVLLAALCHDFGKSSTTTIVDGRVRALGHAEAGLTPTEDFLNRLKIFSLDGFDVRTNVLALVEQHLMPPQLFNAYIKTPETNVLRALRRLSRKVRLDLLALVSLADMLGRGVSEGELLHSRDIIKWFKEKTKEAEVENSAPEPLLKGRHLLELGIAPGKAMGETLKLAYELQLDNQLQTLEDALNWARIGKALSQSLMTFPKVILETPNKQ
jgi:tRNA nucleotidyltransferase (CCA-adding enzyme)